MSINYILVKFSNYAKDLLEGKIYLNSLEYYRGIEEILNGKEKDRNSAINDFLEGSLASVNRKDLEKIGLGDLEKEFRDNLVGNVHLLSEGLKYFKLFCLYALLYDDERKVMIAPSKKLNQFGCEYAVIIKDIEEFRKRLFSCLESGKEKYGIIEVKGDLVDYYNNDEKSKKLGPFNKTSDFWWQHEFRLVFKEMNPNLNAMIIEIGDISDIAYCVKTKELLDDPGAYFPEYKMVFEKEE